MNRFDEIILQTDNASVGINTDGGYVSSWKVLDSTGEWADILYVGSQLKRSGIPILFPYFGKAEKWPQHGFGRNCTWNIVEQDELSIVMELTSEGLSVELKDWYPYSFASRIRVEIGNNGELLYSLEVENRGAHPMPISPGLHPYWAISHEDKQTIVIQGIDGFDARAIDWEHNPPDTRYDFSEHSVIRFPGKQIVIRDVSDKPTIKHLVVWSQTPVKDQDYDFVCIEPICGWNYAIDTDPIFVSSQETWSMKIRFSVYF